MQIFTVETSTVNSKKRKNINNKTISSDWNGTRTHKLFARKRTFNHLAKIGSRIND